MIILYAICAAIGAAGNAVFIGTWQSVIVGALVAPLVMAGLLLFERGRRV